MTFVIEDELKKLPTTPGVYMHKDSLGEIIYVGKAVNLRNRVRQYFRKTAKTDPKVAAMVSNVKEFDYIKCATEVEALVLECNLIKKYKPKYNILLKDDKSYPYIKVTVGEDFPRIYKTRRLDRDGSKYYGPYTDVTAVTRIIELIDEIYTLKKCRHQTFRENIRPCLNYHIGKCLGVCQGKVSVDEYNKNIDEIIDILNGKTSGIEKKLEEKMLKASDELRFEDAARYRDFIKSLSIIGETQRATLSGSSDMDVIIPVVTKKASIAAIYHIRDGKMIGRDVSYVRDNLFACESSSTEDDIVSSYIKQHYTMSTNLPKEILLTRHIEDEDLIEELLTRVNRENAVQKSDVFHKTKILVPERGEKKALVNMAVTDSIELSKSIDQRLERENEKKNALKDRLTAVIERCCTLNGSVPAILTEDDDREYRIEAYDISNLNGLDTVGAMVVYEGRKAIRSDYRKFNIKTAGSGDDYASLQEVIYRRLKRAKNGDEGFSTYPDIMFIDGGLGQVSAVLKIMEAYRMSIPVVGMAKDDAHRTRALVFADGSEIVLAEDPILFSYTGTIQEEVHRFAITFMKGARSKKVIRSALEDIEGVGPSRRKALLQHFGSIGKIKAASYEELMSVNGMNNKVAENVMEFFARSGSENAGDNVNE